MSNINRELLPPSFLHLEGHGLNQGNQEESEGYRAEMRAPCLASWVKDQGVQAEGQQVSRGRDGALQKDSKVRHGVGYGTLTVGLLP